MIENGNDKTLKQRKLNERTTKHGEITENKTKRRRKAGRNPPIDLSLSK